MFSIHSASPQDTAAIVAIDVLTQADEARRACIERWVGSGCACVAREGTKLIGYGAMDRTFFEHALVRMVWVVPQARRRGVGRGLMGAMESACSTDRVFASTNASNVAMRTLLPALGYAECGVIDALDEGDPEIFYVKRLALSRCAPPDRVG